MLFSERFKALREEKGLTQEELSKILGVGRSTIAGYETKSKQPNYELLNKISIFFDVSTDYLLGLTDVKKYSEDILAFNSTEGLTEDDIKLVHQMIQNMRDKNLGKK